MIPAWHWQSILEKIIVGLGILAFWPVIFGYTGWLYQVALLFVVAALSLLALVRYRRIIRAMKNTQQTKSHD